MKRHGQPIIDMDDDFSAGQDMNHLEEADKIKRDGERMERVKGYAKKQMERHAKVLKSSTSPDEEPEEFGHGYTPIRKGMK